MYKNTKDMVKLILLVIIVVSIPLFFITVETIHKFKVVSEIDPEKIILSPLDDFYNKISTAPKNNDPSTIRKCLNEIFKLMNEKQFDKLYALLTDDIKNLMFPTQDQFTEFMQSYLNDGTYSPNFSEYQKLNKEKNDVFVVKTRFLPYSTEKNDLLSTGEVSKTDTFTIYFNEDETYSFSFLSYIGTGKSEKTRSTEKFSAKIAETHLYLSQTTYFIEITNKTDSDMFIDEDGIYVYTGLMQKNYSQSSLIPANQTVIIPYTVYTGLTLSDSLPDRIYFSGVHLNGKVYMFSLTPKYPVNISAF